MSSCLGDIAVTTKVDRDMAEYVNSEAERLGVSRAEFHRRLFELYRESRRENTDCPHCEETIVFELSNA
jgi:negative regulator of replication initiation